MTENNAPLEKSEMWESVIGLEVHVQLNTQTKLFSRALNRFGQEPNTDIDPICTGQPGSLPVLNQEAVRKAIRLGLALNSTINLRSQFDRKSYFYPDSPRNFQITQFFSPLLQGGHLEVEVEGRLQRFAIARAHLEDDSGMLKHFSKFAGVDYNRAGIPLVEIVTTPCFQSPAAASAYVFALKELLEFADISDCNMEEGHLRIDANVSVRLKGETALRNKVEIKNLNSLAFLRAALNSEITRQIDCYKKGEKVVDSTFRWDQESQRTILMRLKEQAHDYRYFPEPDLPPLFISQDFVERERAALPELPAAKRLRYINQLGLSRYACDTLLCDKRLAAYFEAALARDSALDAKALCNWITVELAGKLRELGKSVYDCKVPPKSVAELVNLVSSGEITGKIAKGVADDLIANPHLSPKDIVAANPDYRPLNDNLAVEQLVDEVLSQNRQSITDFKAGKQRAFGHLIGQVMAKSRGTAPPNLVNQLLREKLNRQYK